MRRGDTCAAAARSAGRLDEVDEVLHQPELLIPAFAAGERDRPTVRGPVQMDRTHEGETGADFRHGAASDADRPQPSVEREGKLLPIRGPCDLGMGEATRTWNQQAVDPAKVGHHAGVAALGWDEAQGLV